MKFTIITHAIHKMQDDKVYAYEPYVREMNLWEKYVDEVQIVAPVANDKILPIESCYKHTNIIVNQIPNFNLKSISNILNSLLVIPIIIIKIYKAMRWADHIHLRCPGNIGLLGCLAQICFPKKPKTAKYAGNWDPNAKQPLSYQLQKWLLSNTFLTKNMTVLVYGEWPNQTQNIKPFFTATYREADKKEIQIRKLDTDIHFVFVGTLSVGKRPLLAVQIVEQLQKMGKKVSLSLYGEGEMRTNIENYITQNNLSHSVLLKGNQPKETVKLALQQAHFLLLPSKSEGWPKVVAEAMFWGCLPIVTKISCVPYMLAGGKRGILIEPEVSLAVSEIKKYINDVHLYQKSCKNAVHWSQNYTLDKFEAEIKKLLKN